ncbi:MAG: TPM domain-containing protein, partial [Bacteroidota bacterium]
RFQLFLKSLLFIILSSLSFSYAQHFYTVESIPDPKKGSGGYVSNPNMVIKQGELTVLNQLIAEIEDSTSIQIAVVIVHSIGTENPKSFATRLFNHWGIGQEGLDNGLLIFTVMDQRRTEFETGYGLEGILPDLLCYKIAMQELVPEFKEGNYGEGLIAAVESIKSIVENPASVEEFSYQARGFSSRQETNPLLYILYIYLLIGVLITLFNGLTIWNILRGKEELYDKYLGINGYKSLILLVLFPIPYAFLYIYLGKKLHRLRIQPRFSRETGEALYLLSEKEEDEFLEHGQITEEEIGSVDYDVWASENRQDLLILRYKARFTKYSYCPECGYLSYYLAHSTTLVSPTYASEGKKELVYKCKSCTYRKTKTKSIPKLVQSTSSSGGSSFSSGGGSSWGGGSSGGGGAGVGW